MSSFRNSITFNGADSEFTHKAKAVLELANAKIAEFADHISQLEEKIKSTLERADAESVATSLGPEFDESPLPKKRGRPLKKKPSKDYIDVGSEVSGMSPNDDTTMDGSNTLADDLQYSSEEDLDDEDWENVEDQDGVVGASGMAQTPGFTIQIADPVAAAAAAAGASSYNIGKERTMSNLISYYIQNNLLNWIYLTF